jgi:tetratricopeptide (TPR) repeat protein
MRSSFGLTAIALCSIQVVLVQDFALAQPVLTNSRIAQEAAVRVGRVIPMQGGFSGAVDYSGAIIKKERDVYSVLALGLVDSGIKEVITFDGQSHPILSIDTIRGETERNSYSLVTFRSIQNYLVVPIGNTKSIARNSEIQVGSNSLGDGKADRARVFQLETGRVILNDRSTLLYDYPAVSSVDRNGLILNSRGELIGFHLVTKRSINDESVWPAYGDYPYPTLDSLDSLYGGMPFGPECGVGLGRRHRARQIGAMRRRYHRGVAIDSLNLSAQKVGVPIETQQMLGGSDREDALTTALKAIETIDNSQQILTALNRAIQSEPQNADLYALRGNAKLIDSFFDNDDPDVLSDYNQALQINPQDSMTLYLRSQRQKDSKLALADLNRLVALNPNSSVAYYARGYLRHHVLRDLQGALADYDRLVVLNPQDPRAYLHRGTFKEEDLKDYAGALADYNRVLESNRTPAFYDFLARFKANKLQDFPGALADYNHIIAIEGKNSGAYGDRAALKYKKLKDLQGALTDYNYLISLYPTGPAYYEERAEVRASLGDLEGAVADYNFAVAKEESPEVYQRRGNFRIDFLKDPTGALADYYRALELSSNSAQRYYERGIFRATKLQDRAGAIADFRQAAQKHEPQSDSGELLEKINAALRLYQ